ncbi:hypothetical protein [Planococcus salinus]|uniref:Uncharacterized protein n=1 Tax=Planococcus salinus TaxID=1848460 RepID=A0A3M8P6P5_9BACL|nr:hypothetical protein [Planococcus salinus]RNF39091.1 hypothetical protein EEX84_10305 [Planococcus salinus]
MKQKLTIAAAVLFAGALVALLFLPRDNQPGPDTRVVLEHNYRTYIAPSCFQEADPTNFLEESTLEHARELGYPPNAECTEKAFEGNNDSRFVSLMKELGVMEKEATDW